MKQTILPIGIGIVAFQTGYRYKNIMNPTYLRTINNSSIRKNEIRWVIPTYDEKTDSDCFAVCIDKNGCYLDKNYLYDKALVCKVHSPKSYQVIQDELE